MGSNKLRLNRECRKFLGVCAGIADYLEVKPWTVRLVFVVAFLLGAWFLVPLYFGLYFFLDQGGALRDNATIKHLRNVDYRKKLYRNPRDGKFLGVCAGIADYFEVDAALVRIIVLVLLVVAGPIPWIAYFCAWFVLDAKPEPTPLSAFHDEFPGEESDAVPGQGPHFRGRRHSAHYKGHHSSHHSGQQGGHAIDEDTFRSRRRDIRQCARKFSILHDRLARMEAYVTSPQFKLHREFKNMV